MIFLNVDGTDGSGKSTLVKELQKYFKKRNKKTIHTHFPRYNTEIGKVIRKVLTKEIDMNPAALQMLYSADRVNWSTYQFSQYSKEYDVIIADRYTTSGLVYGQHDGLALEEILHNELRIKKPDIHFILYVDPEIAMERINNRGEQITKYENINTLKVAIKKYKSLRDILPNVYLINSNSSINNMVNQAIKIIDDLEANTLLQKK